jgi:predicted transcriptional regulator
MVGPVVKTTIYLPDELYQRIKQAAKERGTSEAEVIRTAINHELPGALVNQTGARVSACPSTRGRRQSR